MLKVQFRPGPGGDRIQSLIGNCGTDGPSVAIFYDSHMKDVVLLLKTDNETQKELRFNINVWSACNSHACLIIFSSADLRIMLESYLICEYFCYKFGTRQSCSIKRFTN